jgi:hypothetical protein
VGDLSDIYQLQKRARGKNVPERGKGISCYETRNEWAKVRKNVFTSHSLFNSHYLLLFRAYRFVCKYRRRSFFRSKGLRAAACAVHVNVVKLVSDETQM